MDWPVPVLIAALDEIRRARNVDVILLTKWPWLFQTRVNEMLEVLESIPEYDELAKWLCHWELGHAPANLILLTSVLGNALDDKRIAGLIKIPARRRGLSMEPLWGERSLRWLNTFPDGMATRSAAGESTNELDGLSQLQWIIVGCDSSKEKRGWGDYSANARMIIHQCQAAGVPVYHKQMPVNGKVSLDISAFPPDLQIRAFYQPKSN
jgi:protein gp37